VNTVLLNGQEADHAVLCSRFSAQVQGADSGGPALAGGRHGLGNFDPGSQPGSLDKPLPQLS